MRRFAVELIELVPNEQRWIGGVMVTPFLVRRAPPFAFRLESGSKVVGYTGDTEWTEALIPAAQEADLFIAEAYVHDKKIRHHLDWQNLAPHLPAIRPKRVILTHFGLDMLARIGDLPVEAAEDGKTVEV